MLILRRKKSKADRTVRVGGHSVSNTWMTSNRSAKGNCKKKWETGALSNRLLSPLASSECPTTALSFAPAPKRQPEPELSRPLCWCCSGKSPETWFSSSWLGAGGFVRGDCRWVGLIAMNQSHLWPWNGTFFGGEASQRPSAVKVTRRHLDARGHLFQTWLELPGLSHFLSPWVSLLVASSTCFNIWLMAKVTWRAEGQGQLKWLPNQL